MLGWFRALLPREDRFFDLFEAHVSVLVQAAEALQQMLKGGDEVERHCRTIVKLEQQADEITRKVIDAVHRSFITPFDRGDIKDLIESLDDAIDTMNKTVKTVTLFEQRSFDPRMQEMGAVIVQAARLTAEAIPLLKKLSANAGRLEDLAREVTKVEGRADELHQDGLKDLFRRHGQSNSMAFIIGSEIYGQLEKVVDRLEDVANEISGIVVENV
jgi:predicted phosphate transport protein (TIGR00153 family)